MPLSPIQLLAPQTPNSFTSVLTGGGSVLVNALSSAVQLGRDAVNNQARQEQSLLSERRAEINLTQRRAENKQTQDNRNESFARGIFESDRQQGNIDRSFSRGVLESDRNFDLQEDRFVETKERNDVLNAGAVLDNEYKKGRNSEYLNNAPAREEESKLRLKRLDLENKEQEQKLELLPQEQQIKIKELQVREKQAIADLTKVQQDVESNIKDEETLGKFYELTDRYDKAYDEYKDAISKPNASVATARKTFSDAIESIGADSTKLGLGSPTQTRFLKGMKATLGEVGVTQSKDLRDVQIARGKTIENLEKSLSDKDVVGQPKYAELGYIHKQTKEKFANNFRTTGIKDKDATIRKNREELWELGRKLNKDQAETLINKWRQEARGTDLEKYVNTLKADPQ